VNALSSLNGVHLPVTTPFAATGGVASGSFGDNLDAYLAHPISGLVIAGSTGEAPLLSDDELMILVEQAAGRVGDRALIVGTGAESTRRVIANTRAAAERGATAVLVRAPYYYAPAMTHAALTDFWTAVADASPVPVILYHIPKFVPVDVTPDLVSRLVEHPNIVGIKDSTGTMESLEGFISACGSDASALVGSGALLLPALEAGAAGAILGSAVVAPGIAAELYEAWTAGELDRARALQDLLGPLHVAIVVGCGNPGVKAALDRLGLYGGPPRPPLQPVNAEKSAAVDAALEAAGLGASASA
jgi:4-hydroxy-2-oxoglutarate aldolase